ncbi:MAG TPA: SdrD B-like domain-containing protein [Candidatus Anammoximicrobium sp.]|nr:SdrD B-like domain-containing protein [Candidatus Anammoximicrobium sp.]
MDALAADRGIARDADFFVRFRDASADSAHALYLDDVRVTGTGEIHGTVWDDLNSDGTRQIQDTGLSGWTVFLDQDRNGQLDAGEVSTVTNADGDYSFEGLSPGTYVVQRVVPVDWQPTAPVAHLETWLANLDANHATVSALVPTRFDFSEGQTGTSIVDGNKDMYDGGNFLNTDLAAQIPYTNGVVTAADAAFGPGSRYFTAKYDGLFVLAAEDIDVNSFSISGDLGADGGGAADGAVLHTNVTSHEFTLFVKRVYNAGDPSVNQIVIVPGDGSGVTHSFASDTNDDLHTISGLAGVRQLYYLLTARAAGGYLADADVLKIANEFLGKNVAGPAPWTLTVAPGEVWIQADFGNYHMADYGDAPDPAYPTLAASGGARHLIVPGGPYLGAAVDADLDGQPHALALGDDNDGNDDEDGVQLLTRIVPGTTARIEVTGATAGILTAWLDLNADGDWDDAAEHILVDVPLGAGPHTIQPLSSLPMVIGSVVIDATTQPGYAGTPMIELDGTGAGAATNGLWLGKQRANRDAGRL